MAIEADRDADYARRLAQARARGHKGLPGADPKPIEERRGVVKQRARLDRLRTKHQQAHTAETGGDADQPAKPVRNLTDPESRLMRTRHGNQQCYNVQISATADRLVLDCYATTAGNDAEQAVPLMEGAAAAAQILIAAHTHPDHDVTACHAHMCRRHAGDDEPPCDPLACHRQMTSRLVLMLFDAGYFSEANLTADGPDRLIAPGKTSDLPAADPDQPPGQDATAADKMRHKIATPEGKAAYKHRAPDIEGVNASFKTVHGLRQFALRGLKLADFEPKLVGMIHNLGLAHRAAPA